MFNIIMSHKLLQNIRIEGKKLRITPGVSTPGVSSSKQKRKSTVVVDKSKIHFTLHGLKNLLPAVVVQVRVHTSRLLSIAKNAAGIFCYFI